MTLIVEDGTGLTNSNSYVSVVELDSFAGDRGLTLPATTEEKETLLINATMYLESFKYKGSRNTKEQALSWPRTNAYANGFLIDSDEIPVQIKNAQMQAAYELQTSDPLASTGKAVRKEKVDVIEVEYENGGSNQSTRLPSVMVYLDPILSYSSGIRLGVMR